MQLTLCDFNFFCTSDPMNKLITSYYDITKQQLRNIKNTRIKDTSYLYSEVQNFIKKRTIFQSGWETKNQGSTTLPKASQEATKPGSSRNYHAPCFNYLTHWFFISFLFSFIFNYLMWTKLNWLQNLETFWKLVNEHNWA